MNARTNVDELAVRRLAQEEWRASPAIRAEFITPDVLEAFRVAEAMGRVPTARIGGAVVSVSAIEARSMGLAAMADSAAGCLTLRCGTSVLQLSAPVTLKGSPGAGLPTHFSGVAYTGALVLKYGCVIDLSSIVLKARIPLLDAHRTTEVVGVIDEARVGGVGLTVAGKLFSDMPGGQAERIAALAQRGAPFEMSVGITQYTVERVPQGTAVQVNGRTFTGEIEVLRQAHVREVSIVVLGADHDTSVGFR